MKQDWEVKKLGEVCTIVNGGTPKTNVSEYWDGDVNWITPANLGKLKTITVSDTSKKITKLGLAKSSAKLFPENSVILSTRAPIGHLAISDAPMSTNQGCRGLVPSENLYVWFLYYYLKSNVELLNDLGTGATFKELSSKALANIEIPLPALEEQRRIVGVLDEAFLAIDKARSKTQQNLRSAKELFESYLQEIFENKSPDWEEKKLGEIYKVGSSKRVLKSQWKSSGVPFYRGREITRLANYGFVRNDLYITEEHFNELLKSTGTPTKGDIVITAIGTIGNAYIVRETDRFYFKDASVLWLKRISNTSSEFIKYFLKSNLFFSQLSKGNGATVDTLTIGKMQSIHIALPSLEQQQSIVNQLDEIKLKTQKLEEMYQKKIDDLDELKKSILQKAFAGELTDTGK